MRKHSINIHGHQTSITLEDEFWECFKQYAQAHDISINKLIAHIDDTRDPKRNLSSAIRIHILKDLQSRVN